MEFTDTIFEDQPAKQYRHYIVLRDGRIYNERLKRFASIITSSTGYSQVYFDGEQKMLAHIVIRAFSGQWPKRVQYKDFDVKNNHLDNLNWR